MTTELQNDALYTITETGTFIKRKNTSIYQLINSGDLEALKMGRSTRITGKAIKSFIASLPAYKG